LRLHCLPSLVRAWQRGPLLSPLAADFRSTGRGVAGPNDWPWRRAADKARTEIQRIIRIILSSFPI